MALKTSIKTAVFSIVVLAGAVMFALIGLSRYTDSVQTGIQKNVQRVEHLVTTLDQLEIDFLMARRAEKDFLLRHDEESIQRHAEAMSRLAGLLDAAEKKTGDIPGLASTSAEIQSLRSAIAAYGAGFDRLIDSNRTLGLDEKSGLQGQLRGAVHNVETSLKELNQPEMQVKMLMMRRHEKDFIMRGTSKYLDRLNARVDEFHAFPDSYYQNSTQKAAILEQLAAYQSTFQGFVAETQAEAALRKELSGYFDTAEPIVESLRAQSAAHMEKIFADAEVTTAQLQRQALTAGLSGLAVFILVAIMLSLAISRPLAAVNAVLKKMMEGDFSQEPPKSRISEIAAISAAVGVFRQEEAQKDRLTREISEVISACGQGDFSKRIDTSGSQGSFADLGRGVNQIGESAQRGLGDVLAAMDALSDGNLAHRMPSGHQGVFKEIEEAITTVNGNLGEMVSQLTTSSGMLHNTSNEIASAADDASRRGETSAASIEETAGALQTLNETVRGTAKSAEQAKGYVSDAQNQAQSARALADQTVHAIKRVEESSGAIAKITDMIEDVAFQTNLLALNAGVEAARAGEAGRGFAVVASEVRALAQRSAGAAQEINDLIKNSGKEVAEGVALVNDTGTALGAIQDVIERVVGKVGEIADAAIDQANGLSEVNAAVTALDQDAQKNAAMLEETAAAGQMLRNEAGNLIEAIRGFQTEEATKEANGGWDTAPAAPSAHGGWDDGTGGFAQSA